MEPNVRELEARRSPAVLALHRWPRPAELAVHETPAAAAVFHLRLLAVPALVRGDGVLIALERKDAALLALLAVDGPTSRSRAAALLWPDAESQKARNSLRQRLFRLRRAAGSDIVEESAALALASGVVHEFESGARRRDASRHALDRGLDGLDRRPLAGRGGRGGRADADRCAAEEH